MKQGGNGDRKSPIGTRLIRSRRLRILAVGLPLGLLIAIVDRFGSDRQLHLCARSVRCGAQALLYSARDCGTDAGPVLARV